MSDRLPVGNGASERLTRIETKVDDVAEAQKCTDRKLTAHIADESGDLAEIKDHIVGTLDRPGQDERIRNLERTLGVATSAGKAIAVTALRWILPAALAGVAAYIAAGGAT